MEISDLQDEWAYRIYDRNEIFHNPYETPSILKRRSRLIAAAVNNDLDILEELLDAPHWYKVNDLNGYSLLHISIFNDSKDVFNYLLSLPDFPINSASDMGETTLEIAWDADLENFGRREIPIQYYVCKLIEKGVNLVCREGTDILHLAAKYNYAQVLKVLIDQGEDVNVRNSEGYTPLEVALGSYGDCFEVISILFTHGANPTVGSFEQSVINSNISHEIQEFFYLYIKDLLPELEINLEAILQLAINESPLFDELIRLPLEINIKLDGSRCFYLLGTMKLIYVEKIIKKIGFAVFEVFESLNMIVPYIDDMTYHYDPFNIESLDAMLQQTDLQSEMIRLINASKASYLIPDSYFDPEKNIEDVEKKATELCCFLLSYGVNISFELLDRVYSRFGYCQLFKILLHMDVIETNFNHILSWPLFIYDPKMSLEIFLANRRYHKIKIMENLIPYFHHPKLVDILLDDHNELMNKFGVYLDYPKFLQTRERIRELVKNKNQLLMPRLSELARNKFREFFVQKFDIKTSRQFLTVLNSLPINNVYKKIITYEKVLY